MDEFDMLSYFCHLFLYSLHPLLFSCCGLKEPVWSVLFKVVLHLFFKMQYYNIRDKKNRYWKTNSELHKGEKAATTSIIQFSGSNCLGSVRQMWLKICAKSVVPSNASSVKGIVLPGWWWHSGRITLDAVRFRIRSVFLLLPFATHCKIS